MMRIARIALVVGIAAITGLSLAQGGGGGQGRGGGQRGMGGMRDSSGYYLAGRPDVQAEIKVTDDQKTKLSDLQTKMREEMQAARQDANGDQAAMQAAMTKIRGEMKTAYEGIFTADQRKRLHELAIQQAGNAAVADFADVAKDLGLSDDQNSKVKDLKKTHDDANSAIQQKVRDQSIDRTEAAAERKKNDDTLNSEIDKILTDDQKTKLKAMGGAPFKFATGGGGG